MTAPVRVHVVHKFASDPATVFEALSEHENLGIIFAPAKVTRLCDGTTDRNGAGSARELKIGPTPKFVETVTNVVPNELIEYAITGGISPLKGHWGKQVFTATADGGTELDYTIGFNTVVPVPGLAKAIGAGLTNGIKRGLPKLVP
jgi:uncharacterized protein YndB with AHSA1/START domain